MDVRIVWVLLAVSGMVLTSSAQDSDSGREIRGRVTSERSVESDGPVASEQVLACDVNDDCNDLDVCTYDACGDDAQCSNAPKSNYGDVGGNGIASVIDIFCVLDLIAGVEPGGGDACSLANADIHPCEPNGVVNVLDAFAILDAIAGVDPCCGPGVCCLPDDSCIEVAGVSQCDTQNGDWLGVSTSCGPDTCPLN